MPHPSRLIAGMARQANLSALDAMIGAARAGSESAPYLADLAADLSSLASSTAKATKEMTEQVEGTSGGDDIAATLAAMPRSASPTHSANGPIRRPRSVAMPIPRNRSPAMVRLFAPPIVRP